MKSVLSTKKLYPSQRELLIRAGVSSIDYNAIKIEFLSFALPTNINNAIFTSQNGVNSFLENFQTKMGTPIVTNIIENCFCVGEKTKALLERNGQKVVKMTEYASELAPYLVENHKNDFFHFFCGNIRSDEIPNTFHENNIEFEEIKVYTTTLNPKKFEREFDAILFFSPSGVRSYCKEGNNLINPGTVFTCIGTTTAQEAKNYTENVVISNSTTVESVIAKAVKILKN